MFKQGLWVGFLTWRHCWLYSMVTLATSWALQLPLVRWGQAGHSHWLDSVIGQVCGLGSRGSSLGGVSDYAPGPDGGAGWVLSVSAGPQAGLCSWTPEAVICDRRVVCSPACVVT